MLTRESAKSLVVCYHAYMAAAADDHLAVAVWGPMLLEAQTDTGIEMQNPDMIRKIVGHARIMLERAEEAAAS